jgi:hypothetical protein
MPPESFLCCRSDSDVCMYTYIKQIRRLNLDSLYLDLKQSGILSLKNKFIKYGRDNENID